MDCILLSLTSKDKGAQKCLVGVGICFILAMVILYFSLGGGGNSDDCPHHNQVTAVLDTAWRKAPRRLIPCSINSSKFSDELSEFGFSYISPASACKVDCVSGGFDATCPFSILGFHFTLNGTKYEACRKIIIETSLKADDQDDFPLASEDTFEVYADCNNQTQTQQAEGGNTQDKELWLKILTQTLVLGVHHGISNLNNNRTSNSNSTERIVVESSSGAQTTTALHKLGLCPAQAQG